MTQTARIYGDGLYELAAEESLSETILEEGNAVRQLLKDNPDYLRLLAEPSVPKQERLGLLDQAFAGSLSGYLLNFLKILCENHILAEFAGCMEEFRQRYNRDHGIAQAVVTSAVALSDAQAAALKAKLESVSGKHIELTQIVKPSVMGGLRVELEGRLMDGTLSGKLAGLQRRLKATVSIPAEEAP